MPITAGSKWIVAGLQCSPILIYCAFHLSMWRDPAADLILSCIWGILIFQSLLGYGKLFLAPFSPDEFIRPIAPIIGLAILFAVGGILNLSNLFLQPIGFGIIFIGIMISIFLGISQFQFTHEGTINRGDKSQYFKKSVADLLILCIAFIAIVIAYVAAAVKFKFNIHDDAHGYLYFPHKLLELGGLGGDAFSERRVLSGFGAGSLWYAFGLLQIKIAFIHLMDLGIGLLMLSYVFLQFPLAGTLYKTKLLLLAAVGLIAFPIVNITPNFISISIVISIWLVIFLIANQILKNQEIKKIYWFLLGICLSTLISLKNSYIPYAALTVFVMFVFFYKVLHLKFKNCLMGFFWISVTSIGFLVPWFLDLKVGAGTYWYPFLGKGFHAGAYGYFPSATEHFLLSQNWASDLGILLEPLSKSIFLLSIFFLVVLLLCYLHGKLKDHRWLLACLPLTTSLLNVLAVGYAIGGYGAYRFVYATALGSFIAALFYCAFIIAHVKERMPRMRVIIYLIVLLFITRAIQDSLFNFQERLNQLEQSIKMGERVLEINPEPYIEIASAIPRDGRALIRIDYPFLLRPLSKNMLIADYPGSASPSPGMPFGQGPEKLRDFLLSQGVLYIVWGYGNQANFKHAEYDGRLNDKTHSWIRNEAKLAFDIQDNLELLRKKYQNIYDRHGIAIIDLR